MDKDKIILEIIGLNKQFPGVQALKDIKLNLYKGEVLAIVGENGAGKSTLMNIILGSIKQDSGKIYLKGDIFMPKSPIDALNNGISMIHQEITLIPYMDVSDNIWIGREDKFTKYGYLNIKKKILATSVLLKDLDINLNPRSFINNLNTANRQLVEIARAVSYSSDIIIMDEPTSSLTDFEIEKLYKIIEKLKKRDVSIIFITHKLEEVYKICDKVTVLRDGQYIDTRKVKDVSKDDLIKMMVGREIKDLYYKKEVEIGKKLFEVRNLKRNGFFENISFSVRQGEILGLYGLIGAGRSEIAQGIFGMYKLDSGQVFLNGRELKIKWPTDAIKYGLSMVTEDRFESGLFHDNPVHFNLSIAYLDKITKMGFVNNYAEIQDCIKTKEKLDIKISSLKQNAGSLSGGNQQKLIIGKWLLTEPQVLILDEPTRGIDVGAKVEIYKLIGRLVEQNKVIIFISSELEEIIAISDRIIVISQGRITAEINRKDFNKEKIISNAFKKF